jgi:hypothetical protein
MVDEEVGRNLRVTQAGSRQLISLLLEATGGLEVPDYDQTEVYTGKELYSESLKAKSKLLTACLGRAEEGGF